MFVLIQKVAPPSESEHTEQNIQIDGGTIFNFAIFYANLFYCVFKNSFYYPLK